MYVIKEGSVEISITRGERKVVLSTLGRGQFFGEMALLSTEPRSATAKALTYCEFQVIEADALERLIDKSSPIVRYMLRTLIAMVKKKDELVARHAMGFSVVVAYAQLLELIAAPEVVRQTAGEREAEISLPIDEVVDKCMRILRHSRQEVTRNAQAHVQTRPDLHRIRAAGLSQSRLNDKVVTWTTASRPTRWFASTTRKSSGKAQNLPESANQELAGYHPQPNSNWSTSRNRG
jgi:CRP-like cAMP-binding protein